MTTLVLPPERLRRLRSTVVGTALALTLCCPAGSLGPTAAHAGPSAHQRHSPPVQPAASVTVPFKVVAPDPYPSGGGAAVPAPLELAQVSRTGTVAASRVPQVLLHAYQVAAASVPASCHLPVSLLAAIGEVESGSLSGRALDSRHRADILGPVLDGAGFAAVRDTDHGRWDHDRTWDRAVGPMQFLPGTWAEYGVDADGDGVADPRSVDDAAAAAAGYLCFGGRDLADPAKLRVAVLSYNHSTAYLDLVLLYQRRFQAMGVDLATSALAPLALPAPLARLYLPHALGLLPSSPGHRRHHPAPGGTTRPAHHGVASPPPPPVGAGPGAPGPTPSTGGPAPSPTPAAPPPPVSPPPSPSASPDPQPTDGSPQPVPTPSDGCTDTPAPVPSPDPSSTAGPGSEPCPPCPIDPGTPSPTPSAADGGGTTEPPATCPVPGVEPASEPVG